MSIALFSGISLVSTLQNAVRCQSTTATIPTNTGNYCTTIITPALPPPLGLGTASRAASEIGMVMIPLRSVITMIANVQITIVQLKMMNML